MDQYLLDTSNDQLVSDSYQSLIDAHSNPLGDESYVSMDWNKKKYEQLNLIWKPFQKTKIKYSYFNDDIEFQEYDRYYKL